MKKENSPASLPPDKRAHALMGAAVALLTIPVGYWLLPAFAWPGRPLAAAAIAAGVAWLAGLGKELLDLARRRKGKFFDSVDWWYTVLGGMAGGLAAALSGYLVLADPGSVVAASGVLFALGLVIGGAVLRRHGL